jgi:putative tryptophan/tyrosine transport system substrate-binding protein
VRLSRRQVVQGAGGVSLALVAGCGRLPWQAPPSKVYRVGWLAAAEPNAPTSQAFRQAMRERGYVEGENLIVEWRPTGGRNEQLAELVHELIGLPVDVIVTGSPSPTLAAKSATATVPIVFVAISDAVGTGLIASFARPGGNATGLTNVPTGTSAKKLQLLKETVPGITRVAVLRNPDNAVVLSRWHELEEAARVLSVDLILLNVRNPSEFESAMVMATQERSEALYVVPDPLFSPSRTGYFLQFATSQRLPSMYFFRDHVEAGALMSYGPSLPALYQRAAYYVDRILKGTKPADLPVEQPREFDFVINLKTAQALGLTIPQHVLYQATEVIQ